MKKSISYFFMIFLLSCGGGGGGGSSSPIPQTSSGSESPQSTNTPSSSVSTTTTTSESSQSTNTPSSSTSTTTTTSSYNPNLPTSGAISLTGNFDADKITYTDSSEYSDQYGLGLIKASSAYARGATGRGAIIGIMDSGVDTSHQELNGSNKLLPESYLVYQDRSPTTDEKFHGSHVAGIALGERDGSGIHGVAFDAQLFFISIELGTPSDTYDPATIDSSVDYTGLDDGWSQLEAEFVSKEVTVVNGSFGYQGNINDYTEENIRQAFPKTIEVLAQLQKADENKTIFVWAAGNGGGYADQGVDYSSPEVFGGLAYLLPELRGNTAAVVSVDEDGSISSFSNRCGVAQDHCLAAPGNSILSVYAQREELAIGDFASIETAGSQYRRASGTSMAAPHVSGGIALLADYFDGQLGNTEILQRLFTTANKSGIYSDSEIYGQGLMDLDAATKPVGTAMIATAGVPLSALKLKEEGSYIGIVGPAFGNIISEKLSQLSYVVFDELGAPFKRTFNDRILNNIPNINWLTSFQLNPSKRVYERSMAMKNGSIQLGINDVYSHEHNLLSLWADTENKLAYFSFEQSLTQNSKLFFGSGTSPNTYLSSKKGSKYKGIPFLEYSSDGSYIGMDINIPSKKSILFSFFQGSHLDSKRFVNQIGDSKGILLEVRDYKEMSSISYQVGLTTNNSNLLGISSEGSFGQADKSLTSFIGIDFFNRVKDTFFKSSFHVGMTSSTFNQIGMIEDIEDTYFSSFDIGIYRDNIFTNSDSLGVEVYQPLRSERANINFSLPVGRTQDRQIVFQNLNLDLTPSGRQINSQLIYQKNGRHLTFFGKLGLVSNEFHEKESKIKPYFQLDIEFNLE